MASVALVFKSSRASVDTLELTATLSEDHSRTAEVTEHPMETGSDAADHVRQKPTALKLEAIVTDTASASSGDVYAQLEAILDAGDPISIRTALRRYDNMVMTSLDIPRDPKVGAALKFSCAFKSIRFVTTLTVKIQTKQPRVKPGEDGSKKVGEPAEEATVRRSQFKFGTDAGGVTTPGSGINPNAPLKFLATP